MPVSQTLDDPGGLEVDEDGEIVGGQWALVLSSGYAMTFHEVFDYLRELDEDGNGQPDLSPRQASEQVFRYFEFPDYVWAMDQGRFSDAYRPAASGYSFIANSRTSRTELYAYMARLAELI